MKLTEKITDKNLKTGEWNQIGEKLNKIYSLLVEMSEYELNDYFEKMDKLPYGSDEYNKLQTELERKQDTYSIYTQLEHLTWKFQYGTRRSWNMELELNNIVIDAQEMGLNIY